MLTIPLLSIAVAIGVFWKVYAYMAFRKIPKDLKHLPGPKGYPFLGSVLEFPKEFSYHKFKEWSDQYGPIFQVNILGKPHVIISSEDMANDLLALRGAHYSDRPPIVMLHELISATGNLGTSPLNKYWRNSRKLSATALTSRSLEKWNPMQIGEAARLVLDLLSTPDQYEYLFERYSSIVTLRLLYNKDMSLAEERDHVDRITTIVRTLERTVAPGAYLVDFLPILKYLPEVLAPFKTEAKALHEFEYSYFRRLVAEAEETYEPADRLEKRPRGLVHKFFDNKQSWDLTDFEVSYCMGTLLQGGSGTTSSAMQSYCLAMWHYPEWQLKVQKELDEVVGDDRLPSFDDWPNLPTVRAAMKETLRWRPVVPGGALYLRSHHSDYAMVDDRQADNQNKKAFHTTRPRTIAIKDISSPRVPSSMPISSPCSEMKKCILTPRPSILNVG